jgi:Xaa-Pro aminopeptidase
MRQTFDELSSPAFGTEHIPLLRAEMAKQGLDAFVIPHEDEYQNEYLPDCNQRLMWATGFTGSAGAAVVFMDKAAIFVDGRYTVQGDKQTDPALFERRDLVDAGPDTYLKTHVKPGMVVGYDPRLHSADAAERLRQAVVGNGGVFKATEPNPLDLAWGADRPAQPLTKATPHEVAYAGQSHCDKLKQIATTLNADAAILSAPASLAWLFNIRGCDVMCTPLTLGSAIVNADGTARLFLDPAKVTDDLRTHLGNAVSVEHPDTLSAALGALKGKTVRVDPSVSSAWWFEQLSAAGATISRAVDPCTLPRACKNAIEVEGSRQAHIRDGAAIVRFLHWVDTLGVRDLVDEITIATALEGFRDETGALRDISFETIAAAGPNGAFPHYRPTTASNRRVELGNLLLVDSGGQYLDGTTDITRTVAIGTPSAEHIDRFTRVLKGHIALAMVRFPTGTTGSNLDALARLALWSGGFDYDHGTGHGVGSYLGVHEGPQRIAKPANSQALLPGMIVSNEPGYYKVGHYGIRIENLQVVTPTANIVGGERAMLGFESLTMAPIDTRLVDVAMLTAQERDWLNAYHAEVLAKVGPLVPADVKAWLVAACQKI